MILVTGFLRAASDLEAPAVELVFGKIAGGLATYVNGQKVAGTIDPRSPMVYDVKALLHPGENVIAVPAANYGPEGSGLSKGVVLRVQGNPSALHWERSVFNGLAEVIVQSSRDPGTIRLTARSEGLAPVSFELKSQAAAARPAVP